MRETRKKNIRVCRLLMRLCCWVRLFCFAAGLNEKKTKMWVGFCTRATVKVTQAETTHKREMLFCDHTIVTPFACHEKTKTTIELLGQRMLGHCQTPKHTLLLITDDLIESQYNSLLPLSFLRDVRFRWVVRKDWVFFLLLFQSPPWKNCVTHFFRIELHSHCGHHMINFLPPSYVQIYIFWYINSFPPIKLIPMWLKNLITIITRSVHKLLIIIAKIYNKNTLLLYYILNKQTCSVKSIQ